MVTNMKKVFGHKRIACAVVSALLVLTFIFSFFSNKAYADASSDAKRMNVVFVMDESGSMYNTDPKKLRYDAMELFLGLAADKGNYMGVVVFNDDIIRAEGLYEINGKSAKEALVDIGRESASLRDTDIGRAVNKAVDMLEDGKNPQYESAIILLSDGKTDLPGNPKGLEESAVLKSEAINIASKSGMKVYSVCLNANGQASPEELDEISSLTGGESVEVTDANDLKSVFSLFYEMIYGTDSVTLADTELSDSGILEVPFTIPQVGVEEANIIINTINSETVYSLVNPSGNILSEEKMEDMTVKAKTFSVIKVPVPDPGEWKLVVQGISGDQIQISMVYNSDLNIQLMNGASDPICHQPYTFTASMTNLGKAVSNPEIYRKNPMKIAVMNTKTENIEYYDMEVINDVPTCEVVFDDYDAYEVCAYVDIDGMKKVSNVLTFTITNEAPQTRNITIKKAYFPFTKPIVTPFADFISDREGDELVYSVKDSSLKPDSFVLTNDSIEIDIAKSGKGDIEIQVADGEGLASDFTVCVQTVNLFFIILAILGALIIAVVVLILIKKRVDGSRPIPGQVRVVAFSNGSSSAPEIVDGVKGKMLLSKFFNIQMDTGILLGQSYFIAGEKESYIYFVSNKKEYLTDYSLDKPVKKIRLDDQNQVVIYGDNDMMSGIRVTYLGMNDYGYGF